ncbi:LTA synthase family protein [Bacillus shivajii]|uniref:LTA synthase family protein n=1 Tax=Bacillus shivajii TaxID=1983719 RepID=UPI001CFC3B21|nr:LTA synthase family protein [Bacillus shivajii]UCZ54926.1 LTA synthase family protein [Bacillus shivajii]
MKFLIKHWLIFLIPLLSLLVIETIHRSSILELGGWLLNEPRVAFINYLLYFSLFNVFYLGKQKHYVWFSYGFILAISILAFISYVKVMYRSVPLHPSDFKLIKEAFTVIDYFYASLNLWLIGLLFLVVVLVTLFVKKMKADRMITRKMSFVMVGICFIILFSFFSDKPIPLEKWGSLSTFSYAQSKHYDINGFSLGFLLLSTYKDDENTSLVYSEENVLEVRNLFHTDKPSSGFSPNVLYIMSESFWDPTIIDTLQLEKDPIPFFRQLKEESTHGELVVPVFGGNTGNTEFEALTGMSISFLGGSHVIPFNEGIEQPVDSIASMLTRQGYVATAMHPFNMGYYNRIETYNELGFQNFIPPEYMYNRERRGKYVSDEVFIEQVVDKVENADKPVFVHAVTMENHGPYDGKKFKEHTISVDGPISAENKKYTQDYVQGLIGADAALEYLISELKRINEPTVVVFFGDHLPYLGQFDAYKQLGFIENETLENYEDYMRIHTTPFIIWNNFGVEKEELRMSSNFLTPYVLDMIQKEGNALTNYLQDLMKKGLTVIPPPQFQENEGLTSDRLKPYELLQTDTLSGEQFAYGDEFTVEQEDYHLGRGKMTLKEGSIIDSQLIVKGDHFVPASKVFINGDEVDTQFISPELLSASIPNHDYGQLEVEIVTIDEWVDEVLEQTKSIIVEQY